MANTDTSAMRERLAGQSEAAVQRTGNGDGKPLTIAQLIDRQRTEIQRALPKHMDADRLARIATTVIKTTPKLLECSASSLLGSLMLSAQTGMEPGPLGHAYFVPRKIKGVQECQWILGYKGIIELARRSGKILSIEAREVCERDEFEYSYGLDEQLVHKPYMDGDRGPIVAFWGLAKFADGGHYFLVMSNSDIEKARARSDAFKAGFGPWVTDYAAMGRKTVIRRMAPFLPLAAEQAQVIAHDESVHTRIGPEMSADPPDAGWLEATYEEVEPGAEPDPAVDPDGSPSVPPPEGEAAGSEPDFEAITEDQSKELAGIFRAAGITGDERFDALENVLGHPVGAVRDLTTEDAQLAIDALLADPVAD